VQLSAPPRTVCREMACAISVSVFLFDLLVYAVFPAIFAGTASGGRTLIDAVLLASISCLSLTLRIDSFNHSSESLDLSAAVFGCAKHANKKRKSQVLPVASLFTQFRSAAGEFVICSEPAP
jgi:hypothetical protein